MSQRAEMLQACQMNKLIFELWRVDNYLMSWRKEANLCVMFVLLCNAHTASPLLQHLSPSLGLHNTQTHVEAINT